MSSPPHQWIVVRGSLENRESRVSSARGLFDFVHVASVVFDSSYQLSVGGRADRSSCSTDTKLLVHERYVRMPDVVHFFRLAK